MFTSNQHHQEFFSLNNKNVLKSTHLNYPFEKSFTNSVSACTLPLSLSLFCHHELSFSNDQSITKGFIQFCKDIPRTTGKDNKNGGLLLLINGRKIDPSRTEKLKNAFEEKEHIIFNKNKTIHMAYAPLHDDLDREEKKCKDRTLREAIFNSKHTIEKSQSSFKQETIDSFFQKNIFPKCLRLHKDFTMKNLEILFSTYTQNFLSSAHVLLLHCIQQNYGYDHAIIADTTTNICLFDEEIEIVRLVKNIHLIFPSEKGEPISTDLFPDHPSPELVMKAKIVSQMDEKGFQRYYLQETKAMTNSIPLARLIFKTFCKQQYDKYKPFEKENKENGHQLMRRQKMLSDIYSILHKSDIVNDTELPLLLTYLDTFPAEKPELIDNFFLDAIDCVAIVKNVLISTQHQLSNTSIFLPFDDCSVRNKIQKAFAIFLGLQSEYPGAELYTNKNYASTKSTRLNSLNDYYAAREYFLKNISLYELSTLRFPMWLIDFSKHFTPIKYGRPALTKIEKNTRFLKESCGLLEKEATIHEMELSTFSLRGKA